MLAVSCKYMINLKFVWIQIRMLSGLKNKQTRIHIINLGECIQQCKQSENVCKSYIFILIKVDTINFPLNNICDSYYQFYTLFCYEIIFMYSKALLPATRLSRNLIYDLLTLTILQCSFEKILNWQRLYATIECFLWLNSKTMAKLASGEISSENSYQPSLNVIISDMVCTLTCTQFSFWFQVK